MRGVLLCEDTEHETFFRHLLLRKNFRPVRVERIPNRQGAGDAWVLKRYAKEVQYARSKSGENFALVVAIDGDRWKLPKRLRQLDEQLIKAGLSKREGNEKTVIFVPTRNIEPWELWLCGDRDVDEDGDFKSKCRKARGRGAVSAKAAVAAWFEDPSADEENTLPSLTAGRAEIGRLESRAG